MRTKQLPPPGGPGHSCHRRLGLYDQANDERRNNGGPDGGAAYRRNYRAGRIASAVKKTLMRTKQLPPPGGPGHSCHRRLGLYDQANDERRNNGGPDGGAAYGRDYPAGLSGAAVKKSPAYVSIGGGWCRSACKAGDYSKIIFIKSLYAVSKWSLMV
uniref:hypothetical protein n=1 Tax=uncultured Megasphaera sp. TaxID=165188 RepID=UPI002585A39D|nr:hypothetical protein [uncultured Megasphaera sp.]